METNTAILLQIIYITNKYSNKVTFLRKYFGMYRYSSTTIVKKALQTDRLPQTANISPLFHANFLAHIKSRNCFHSILGCHSSVLMELFHTSFQFWPEMSN
jgi:hypothetical protein